MDRLNRIAEQILHEAVTAWWDHAQAGTIDCVPHISAGVQTAVRWGIGYRKRSVPEFLKKQMTGFNSSRRRIVLRMFALLGTADRSDESRVFLTKYLSDEDLVVRKLALEALEAQRAAWTDHALVDAAISELDRGHITVRIAAARLIHMWLDGDAPALLRARVEQLALKNKHVRYALDVAASTGSQTPWAGEADLDTRENAFRGLQLTHTEVARYLQDLKHVDAARRAAAARRLGRLHREGVRIYSRNGELVVLLPIETRAGQTADRRRR